MGDWPDWVDFCWPWCLNAGADLVEETVGARAPFRAAALAFSRWLTMVAERNELIGYIRLGWLYNNIQTGTAFSNC